MIEDLPTSARIFGGHLDMVLKSPVLRQILDIDPDASAYQDFMLTTQQVEQVLTSDKATIEDKLEFLSALRQQVDNLHLLNAFHQLVPNFKELLENPSAPVQIDHDLLPLTGKIYRWAIDWVKFAQQITGYLSDFQNEIARQNPTLKNARLDQLTPVYQTFDKLSQDMLQVVDVIEIMQRQAKDRQPPAE